MWGIPLFNQLSMPVFPIGIAGPGGVNLLGTVFAVTKTIGVTAAHVVGTADANLSVVLPRHRSLGDYQDTTDLQISTVRCKIAAYDAIRDLALVELLDNGEFGSSLQLATSDDVAVGGSVTTFGYPHAPEGRMVQTAQTTWIGARILMGTAALKTKQVVLNVQARPGQSGSPVIDMGTKRAVAVVLGGWMPPGGSGIRLGNIDPITLHQTTHAISCEYVQEMLGV